MLATIHTMSLYGIEAIPVTVEVNITRGLHRQITGLPDQSVKEFIDRLPDTMNHLGYKMPRTRVTFHLSPASIPKRGSSFDLPILIALLLASEQITDLGKLKQFVLTGEVALDGSIKSVRGALFMAEKAKKMGFKGILLPACNTNEAALINNIEVYSVHHVKDVIAFIQSDCALHPVINDPLKTNPKEHAQLDYKNLAGQHNLKRCMEIAAAGGHHTIMQGPPGCGKSSVAKRLPSILPPMTKDEILETTRIYSVQQNNLQRLMSERPFRQIHHTISDAGLMGGGLYASCGEITLAHNGVLLMDEFSEFKPSMLEALREPLEDRKITVARNKAIVQYPAAFLLIAATNPCLCGYFGHPTRKCTCSKRALYWFHRKISGSLLDRFDLQVNAEPVSLSEMNAEEEAESSTDIQRRVIKARSIQVLRFKNAKGIHCNAQMNEDLIKMHCAIDQHSRRFLMERLERLQMSARAYAKIMKVARTIADLCGKENIELAQLAEAIHFRSLDQPLQKITDLNAMKRSSSEWSTIKN